MQTKETPMKAEVDFNQNVGDLFEVVAKVEERETGVFSAALNRQVAKALAEAGYSLNPNAVVKTHVGNVFEIIITVEQQVTGVFRAALARTTAKELVEAGCSR